LHFRNHSTFLLILFFLTPPLAKGEGIGAALVAEAEDLLGVPFAEYPRREPGKYHPTELKQYTNCAGVVIYGLRRVGILMRYTSAAGLRRVLSKMDWEIHAPATFRTGDIFFFGNQSALLTRDTEPKGRLNDSDEFLYAHYAPVKKGLWRDLPFRQPEYGIFRPVTAR